MNLETIDIDQLLEATTEIAGADYGYVIDEIDIDVLLDDTDKWI